MYTAYIGMHVHSCISMCTCGYMHVHIHMHSHASTHTKVKAAGRTLWEW